jgi:hypothetical protein
LLFVVAALFVFSGCIVHHPRRHHRHRHYRVKSHKRRHHPRRARCAPSHYWDGHRCRHRGRGRGARKHDY